MEERKVEVREKGIIECLERDVKLEKYFIKNKSLVSEEQRP